MVTTPPAAEPSRARDIGLEWRGAWRSTYILPSLSHEIITLIPASLLSVARLVFSCCFSRPCFALRPVSLFVHPSPPLVHGSPQTFLSVRLHKRAYPPRPLPPPITARSCDLGPSHHRRLATRIPDAPRGRIAIQDLFLGRYVLPFLLRRIWGPQAQEHVGARGQEETGRQTTRPCAARERRGSRGRRREAQVDVGET